MPTMIENESKPNIISKSAFSSGDDTFTSCSVAALVAKNGVPLSHKRIADNYIVIKQIFKFQLGLNRITKVEKALLEKYDFNVLECTTTQQMYNELALLQKWSISDDLKLRQDSDNILQIRVGELKYLEAISYTAISNEIYNGYKILLQYLKEISNCQSGFGF